MFFFSWTEDSDSCLYYKLMEDIFNWKLTKNTKAL